MILKLIIYLCYCVYFSIAFTIVICLFYHAIVTC